MKSTNHEIMKPAPWAEFSRPELLHLIDEIIQFGFSPVITGRMLASARWRAAEERAHAASKHAADRLDAYKAQSSGRSFRAKVALLEYEAAIRVARAASNRAERCYRDLTSYYGGGL